MDFKLQISEEGMDRTLGRLVAELLRSKAVTQVFCAQYDSNGDAVYGTLTGNPEAITRPAMLVPYINGNKGREASLISGDPGTDKLALLLRPCEARAFVELTKFKQAHRENTLLITTDCPGTLSLDEYKCFRATYPDSNKGVDAFYTSFNKGERAGDAKVRDCCMRCDSLAHPAGDIGILMVGAPQGEIVLRSYTETGEEALKKLQLDENGAAVDEAVRESFAGAQTGRSQALAVEWKEEVKSINDFLALITHCRRCYNCRAECPICYCRECVFQTEIFDVQPETFALRAKRLGIIKMPPDTLLFHLTRMNHMATSCVACGQCTEACPQGIPVGKIFSAVSAKTQSIFEYCAGMDADAEPPLTIYQEQELDPR